MTEAVIFVALRTITASNSFNAPDSNSSEEKWFSTTSCPSVLNCLTADESKPSVTAILAMYSPMSKMSMKICSRIVPESVTGFK